MTRLDIRILRPGDEHLLEPFLLSRLETSIFLLSNMRASLTDTGLPFSGTYVAAFENGEIVSVVGHFWNGNLVYQAPSHLAVLTEAAVQASGRPVKGVIGPEDQARSAHGPSDETSSVDPDPEPPAE